MLQLCFAEANLFILFLACHSCLLILRHYKVWCKLQMCYNDVGMCVGSVFQSDQPSSRSKAGGADAAVITATHRQHRSHLLHLLHHLRHPGRAGWSHSFLPVSLPQKGSWILSEWTKQNKQKQSLLCFAGRGRGWEEHREGEEKEHGGLGKGKETVRARLCDWPLFFLRADKVWRWKSLSLLWNSVLWHCKTLHSSL